MSNPRSNRLSTKFRLFIDSVAPSLLAKRAVALVLGDGTNFFQLTVLSMIFARLISVDEMGTYRQVLLLGQITISLGEFGISASVYRMWPELSAEMRSVFLRMIFALLLLGGVLTFVLLFLFAPAISSGFSNKELYPATIAAAFYNIAAFPAMLLRPVLVCEGKIQKAVVVEAGMNLSRFISLIAPIYFGGSLQDALVVWSLTSFGTLFLLPYLLRPHMSFVRPFMDKKMMKDMWEYIWPIQIARLPGFVTAYFDKLILAMFLTPSGFAVYSIGARELPFIGSIAYSVSNVLLPALVSDVQRANIREVAQKWSSAIEKTARITYVMGAFTFVNAMPIMIVLFSSQYEGSAVPFRILSLLIFFRVIEYSSLAKAFDHTRAILSSTVLSAIALVVLAIPLMMLWSGAGMALAVLLSNLTSIIFLLHRNRSLLGLELESFFPWKSLCLLLAYSFLSVFMAKLIVSLFVSSSSNSVPSLILQLVVELTISASLYYWLATRVDSAIRNNFVSLRTFSVTHKKQEIP